MKRSVFVLFLFLFSSAYSQNTINNYKYVIVPEKFTFLKVNDQYGLNSVTKNLLQGKGFIVFFDNNEMPADVANNKCLALTADVSDKSGMFSTTLILVLKDCHGNIVFNGKPGKSREKDFSTGYNMALTETFKSLDQVPYTYNGSNGEPAQPVVAATTNVVVVTEKQTLVTTANTAPIVAEKQAPVTTVIATPAVTEKQVPVTTPVKTTEPNNQVGTLYAQAIPNGYQLIDTTPKKVLTLLKTSADNYFIASSDTANGIVLKINGEWFFEYYEGGKLVSTKLLVKF